MMRLPDFLCVGAAKAGSTTLHEQLSRHPDLWLPPEKELHFFDNDEKYHSGVEYYQRVFRRAPPGKVLGEVTPAYMSYEFVPKRICETLGRSAKLIFSLREPVSRAYSEYLHNHRRGYIEGEFLDVINKESDDSTLSAWDKRKFSFLSRGCYMSQIRKFCDYFPRENMRFIVMEEDLSDRISITMSMLFDFLGVAPQTSLTIKRFNQSYVPRSMLMQKMLFSDHAIRRVARKLLPSQSARTKIRRAIMSMNARRAEQQELPASVHRALQEKHFKIEIEELEVFLERDLSCWRVAG